jgi:hypothetical protein
MNLAAKVNKKSPKFPRAKISEAVAQVLKGKDFSLKISTSPLGKLKIVRVITPAWKSLRREERILKVLDAVDAKLTREERNQILRYSVLTPEEYDRIVLGKAPQPRAA